MAQQNPLTPLFSGGNSNPFGGQALVPYTLPNATLRRPAAATATSAMPIASFVAVTQPRAPPLPDLLVSQIEKTSTVNQKAFDDSMDELEETFVFYDQKIALLEAKQAELFNVIESLHNNLKKLEAFNRTMISAKTEVRPIRSPRPTRR